MTTLTVEEDAPTLGSVTARVYTPPLPVNCDGDPAVEACCPCGCGLNARTSWGFDCVWFLLNVVGRWVPELIPLPWEEWLYIHALEKKPGGKIGFRFRTLVILVARQNGKTTWLKGLGLYRLYLTKTGRSKRGKPSAKVALIACQNLDYAETMLKEIANDVLVKCPALLPEFRNYKETNGKHRLMFTNSRLWRVATASRKGARSMSTDLAEMDEVREQYDWSAWNAIEPTTQARPFGQTVATSNAGDVRSLVLRSLKDTATKKITTHDTADTQTGYFEWSVPMDVDPRDRKYWYLANPAMGYLPGFTLESLDGKLENMQFTNMAGFRTEYLCQWVNSLDPGIIPAEDWQETMDALSCRAPDSPIYAAVDVNFKRTWAYIAIAARRADGHLHTEVVAAARGTDWVIPWFRRSAPWTDGKARKDKVVAVAVQARGAPASEMIEPMVAAGIPVMEWGGSELAQGTSRYFDKIVQHVVFHRPQGVLDRAAESTVSKRLGDTWLFDRRHSPVDAAPLIACAAACWAEGAGPIEVKAPPEVHAWPDEETMEQWIKEAEEDDGWKT